MSEIIGKISSYNIFNFLFPGIIFCSLIKEFTSFSLPEYGILENIFIYYFCGLCISRFGSIAIEPILKKIKFIKFSQYEDYIEASKNDATIKILLEVANTYRTILAVFIIFIIVKIYEPLKNLCSFFEYAGYVIIFLSLITIFLYSYKKQINFIVKRIDKYKKDKQNGNS